MGSERSTRSIAT